MPIKPANPGGGEQVVVRHPKYEIATSRVGAFTVVRLRGAYADDVLLELRNNIFRDRSASFAMDASGMTGVTAPLAREFLVMSQTLRSRDRRLVLLNPPDALRNHLALIASSSPLTIFLSESQLTVDPQAVDQKADESVREIARIRREIQVNKLWQYVDRESWWLCPFCATVQEDIVIPSRLSLSPLAAERIYKHLWFKCPKFQPVNPVARTAAELDATLKRMNEDKVALAKGHLVALESKLSVLEDKAKRAEALEQSVKVASARQKRLLPAKPPDVPFAEIGLVYRPAEHVSGDFYDFIPLPDGRLAFIIGDVAGHGIEAGILMGMSKKVLALRIEEIGDPVKTILQANNDLFRELDRQIFVTAFVAVYDPATRLLKYARAGHNPPLLFNPARDPKLIKLETGGLGLGMSKGEIFSRGQKGDEVQVQPGDLMILYTDGLTEAKNQAGEEFQVDRMASTLEETAGKTPSFVLGVLSYELDRFCIGIPQEDDVTAVGVLFK